MSTVRFIGDVHGKTQEYLAIINEPGVEASIQVGDLAFNYDFLKLVSSDNHVIIPGNHDNYDIIGHNVNSLCPLDNFLHGFGSYFVNGLSFFYTSGAFSIDWYSRLQKERIGYSKSWWSQEELTIAELRAAVEYYKTTKPDIVVTHDCPKVVSKQISDGSALKYFGYHPETFETHTQLALGLMLNVHRPKLWVFGHYHTSFDKVIEGTRFKCLAELEVYDYEI